MPRIWILSLTLAIAVTSFGASEFIDFETSDETMCSADGTGCTTCLNTDDLAEQDLEVLAEQAFQNQLAASMQSSDLVTPTPIPEESAVDAEISETQALTPMTW